MRNTLKYILVLLLLFPQFLSAQCSSAILNFSLGNDTVLCSAPYLIDAGGNFQTYEWSNSSNNSTLLVNQSGNYWCEVSEINGNLITNGDFESGATAFTSDYVPATGGAYGPLSNQGEYMVSTSAALTHNNFLNCTDHTSGSGNMLVVNGSNVANSTVWCQTINNITPNTDYAFSCWAQNVLNNTNISNLQFFVNGAQIGPVFNTSTQGCLWQQFTETWFSGTSTSATICITNQNTTSAGNDFAIDDIVFGPICTSTDTVNVSFENNQQTSTVVDPLCFGSLDGEIHIDNPNAVEYSFDNGVNYQVDSFLLNLPAGNYNICSKSALGCEVCGTATLSNPAPITISVSNDTTVCENGTATVTAAATNGISFDYHWNFTANTGSTQTVSPGVLTSYNVYAENQNNCLSDTVDYTVDYYPPLNGQISPDTLICPNGTATLTSGATGGIGGPYTFNWSNNFSENQNQISTTNVTPQTTTNYSVQINDACESTPITFNTNVVISPMPTPGFTAVEIEKCEPATFDLTSTTDPNLTGNIEWLINSLEYHPTGNNINTDVYLEGSYDVEMTVTTPIGCIISETFTDTLIAHPLPVASFDYGPKPIYMFSPQVDFYNNSLDAVSYNWIFFDGNPGTSNSFETTVDYPEGVEGNYTVLLEAISNFGCRDTIEKAIKIEPEILIFAPNSFTPDDDEFNPNWRIYMKGIDEQSFDLKIYNRWGELVFQSRDINQPWDGTYNGSLVKDGTYIWVLEVREFTTDKRIQYKGSINVLK